MSCPWTRELWKVEWIGPVDWSTSRLEWKVGKWTGVDLEVKRTSCGLQWTEVDQSGLQLTHSNAPEIPPKLFGLQNFFIRYFEYGLTHLIVYFQSHS